MSDAAKRGPFEIGWCYASAIRKASRRISALYDDALAPCGLRSTQYTILAELERHFGHVPTLNEFAKSLVMDRSGLGHNLRPLERDGLIALQAGGADRRSRHIVLTARGQAKLDEAKPLWAKAQGKVDRGLGKRAAGELRAALIAVAYDERLVIDPGP